MYDFSVFNDFFYAQFGEGSTRFETIVDQMKQELDGGIIPNHNFVKLYFHLQMRKDTSVSRFFYLKKKYVKKNMNTISSYFEAYIYAKYLLLSEADKKKLNEILCDSWILNAGYIFKVCTDDFLEEFFCGYPMLDFGKVTDFVLATDKKNELIAPFEDDLFQEVVHGKIVKDIISKYFGAVFLMKLVYFLSERKLVSRFKESLSAYGANPFTLPDAEQNSEKNFCADFVKRYDFVQGLIREQYISIDLFSLDFVLVYKLNNYNELIQTLRSDLQEFKFIGTKNAVATACAHSFSAQDVLEREIETLDFTQLLKLNKNVYDKFIRGFVEYSTLYYEFHKYYFRIICCHERAELWMEFVQIVKEINAASAKAEWSSLSPEFIHRLKKDGE